MTRFPILWGCAALALTACSDDDDDSRGASDDEVGTSATRFAGHLYNEDTLEDLANCEVGVTRSQAVRSGTDGRFSIDVERQSVVNVRCEGGLVRSFQLPDVDAVNWEINIDFYGAVIPSTDCVLNLEADFSGLGMEAEDGFAEIRVLQADGDSTAFSVPARANITFLGLFATPPGPFRVLARAFGGSVAGFGASDLASCPGDSSTIDVLGLVATLPTTVVREGTWEDTGDGPTLEVYGDWVDTAEPLEGLEVRLDHLLETTPSGFQVTVLDGLTTPSLRAKACRTGIAGRACVHRENIAPGGPIAIGSLPQHMIAGARMGSGRLEMFTDRPVAAGAVTGLLIDATDPFNPTPIWKGWSPTGSLRVSTEWIGTVPPLEFLTFIPSGQENVEYDFATDFAASVKPDGWVELRPASSDVAAGG